MDVGLLMLLGVSGVVGVYILFIIFQILFVNPHDKSVRKVLKDTGEVGVWAYSFGGWTRHYSMEYIVRYLHCDGGYIVMYKKKWWSQVFFIPDYYELKEVTGVEKDRWW